LSAMAGCDRDAPAEPPAPRTAPASQADDARLVQAAPAGTSAGSTAEAPVAGPKGTEYPVPSKPAESQGAPAQHAEDSPANAPGDLTPAEERSQMPMAGQGHNYSGDARKAGQEEATPVSAEKPQASEGSR